MSDVATFLHGTPWADWTRTAFDGDASQRRYWRLTGARGATAILMLDPPGPTCALDRFIPISGHLRAAGLCAPDILHADPLRGFAVIADLGAATVAHHLGTHPQDETAVYQAATDVLIALQYCAVPPGLAALTPDVGATMTHLFADHFAPQAAVIWPQVTAGLETALGTHTGPVNTLSLRDFHAENLIWRPELTGTDRIGLLDFQDAVATPALYDLVSLLRDVRRDISAQTHAACTERMQSALGMDSHAFNAAFAVIAVQRNLRILGIFERLIRLEGKTRYAAFVPRTLRLLQQDLTHPALHDIAALVSPYLTAKTP